MDKNKILAMCRDSRIAHKQEKRTRFAFRVYRDIGLTDKDIQSTKIESAPWTDDEFDLECKKKVKAVEVRLRTLLCQFALDAKVIEIGKDLPVVGRWIAQDVTQRPLVCVSDCGFLILKKSTTARLPFMIDPLQNADFIHLLT